MNFAPITLEGFEGRESALAKIKRYIHHITPIMFYRTNDLIHSRRVLWHLEESVSDIQNIYLDNFDVDFARTLALVHDDVEILTGDVQLYDKENMRSVEFDELAQKEKGAISKIVKMHSTIANGYDYEKLLITAKDKNKLESQFVSFFDKFDGGGEAWHEVWAGNRYFLLPAGGNHGQQGGYVRRLCEFPEKYPDMKKFFNRFPDYLPEPFNFSSACKKGTPHTELSIRNDSGYSLYEKWKKNIIKHEGISLLINQVEFS